MEIVTDIIREALKLPTANVQNIRSAGGMTNLNYIVSIDGVNYIVRLPGKGTEDIINRSEEKANLKFASSLGINPELRYFNSASGLKITEKIPEATTMTSAIAKEKETMKKVAEIFRTLHHSNREMTNHFKLFELMARFESLALLAGADLFEGFESVKEDVLFLKNYYLELNIEEVPCHIDPACSNFILCEAEKIYLIDWEYSGMFDPIWDIAAYSLEADFSPAEEAFFVKEYFRRDASVLEERMLLHKIFQDYLWSLWSLFKEEKGDDFGSYARNRFERAKINISLYKKTIKPNKDFE